MTDESREDVFFGMKSQVEPEKGITDDDIAFSEGDEFEIEVVDDRPEADRRPPVMAPGAENIDGEDEDDTELSESELQNLGNRARKRIEKLSFKLNEQRRRAEESDRIAQEAARHVKRVVEQRDRVARLAQTSQKALVSNEQKRAEAAVGAADSALRVALAEGDPDKIADAQKALNEAQASLANAPRAADPINAEWVKEFRKAEAKSKEDARKAGSNPVQQPSDQMKEWHSKNDWFGKDQEKTAFAYGVHNSILQEGVPAESPEYFRRLDSRIKQVYGSSTSDASVTDDGGESVEGARQSANAAPAAHQPVAPATRNSGHRGRKVTLTRSQIELCQRNGWDPKKYAAELMKMGGK